VDALGAERLAVVLGNALEAKRADGAVRRKHVHELADERRPPARRALSLLAVERADAAAEDEGGEVSGHRNRFAAVTAVPPAAALRPRVRAVRSPERPPNFPEFADGPATVWVEFCCGFRIFVMIRTILGRAEMDTYSAGTLAGAGCFRCGACGYAVALHELDQVPACPHCGGEDFRRSSIFGELSLAEPIGSPVESPDWLEEAREALVTEGDYLAYETDDRVRVVALQEGWTRVGRSLSAHIRFDDPTVSRRHALVHRQDGSVRVLDDRSLNGLFVNGERIDLRELHDGDELQIGRFRLYYIGLTDTEVREPRDVGTAVA
jgi:hypothetical protein